MSSAVLHLLFASLLIKLAGRTDNSLDLCRVTPPSSPGRITTVVKIFVALLSLIKHGDDP
jgi:hypothetical protein